MPMISTCPRCQRPVSIPSNVEPAALVRCPLCEAEYALSEALALAPPELIPIAPRISDVAAEETTAPVQEPIVYVRDEENEAAIVASGFRAVSAAGRRRRKQKSVLQTLIEVVTGGLAGCLVAYYGLAFWFGPQFRNVGLPQLPLPGIAAITAPRPADEAKPPEKKPSKDKSTNDNHRNVDQTDLAAGAKTAYSFNMRCPEPENVALWLSFAPESHS